MRSRYRQRGVSAGMIGVVLVLIIAGFLGTQLVSRMLQANRIEARVQVQLESATRALEQFVATGQRLPCPANPALDTGDEVLPTPGAATCSFPEGTVPWKSIGLGRDDAIDPWGYKISYRVYTGAAGSFTQPGGASMVECDSVDPSPASTTALSGSAGALCQAQSRVTLRSTPPGSYAGAGFLHSKGLTVSDLGSTRNGVAFVLVSHGATGRGAYTTSGTRRDMPLGDELANTGSAGPFVIKAFSAAGTDPESAAHFDDVVAYRTVEDLIKAAGLYARNWPEEATTTVTFDQPTVEAAVGGTVTPGTSVGQVSVSFTGVVASGIDSGGNPTDVGFDVSGGIGGIGVAGGGSAFLQSSASELLRLDFEKATKFGVTLNHFGYYGSGPTFEIAEFRFFSGGVQVGASQFAAGCNVDGGLASFSLVADATFDRVDIIPYPAFDFDTFAFSGITAFLVSAVKACPASAGVCESALATPANTC